MSGIGQVSDDLGFYVATSFWTTLTTYINYYTVAIYRFSVNESPSEKRKAILFLVAIETGITALWLPYFFYCLNSQNLATWHWVLVLTIALGVPSCFTVIYFFRTRKHRSK
jgi:hypothetical protein